MIKGLYQSTMTYPKDYLVIDKFGGWYAHWGNLEDALTEPVKWDIKDSPECMTYKLLATIEIFHWNS